MLAGELGESRDGSRRREAEIALERKAQRAASGSEFRLPAAEVAETEGQMAVRVQLRGEPGGVAVGCEDLDDGFEVDGLVLAVDGGALGAAILEEFLALGGDDQLHVFDSGLGGPQRSVHPADGPRRGPPGVERSSSVPDQKGIEAAPAVTAALRWRGRGRCVFKALRVVEPSQAARGQFIPS